ncbi:MAG TPA: ethylbenzene dehydrogenase-related protein [Beijerinckiaceae bacterium]|jgi:cytochrome b subunit of formate dehydrogenase
MHGSLSPRVVADAKASSSALSASKTSSWPTSDIGTVILHWTAAVAMFVSLFTGLRLTADNLDSVVAKALSPILPQGEIWTWHFVAGLALFFASTAYALYMIRSGLANRVALKKLQVLTMPAAPKLRWGAVNVALHWALYALVAVLTATGILLYLGHGGIVVTIHVVSAFATLAYTAAHLVGHFGYGGWLQLLRVFRPARLVPSRGMRAKPLLAATAAGVAVAGGVAGADLATRDVLVVKAMSTTPKLDGHFDDAVWSTARPVTVRTQQGVNLGGTGESTVEVRAVRDDKKIYFAFRWQDPTRSLFRLPMIKKADGWHVVGTRAGSADVNDFYEDKFSVIFSESNAFGGGGSTHMGPRPVADRPSSLNERGLHFTADGSTIDMWQWKASRGGMLGLVDDQYIGPIRPATADETAKRARYQGGYWNDPGKTIYSYNFAFQGPGGFQTAVTPRRLPKDWKAIATAMGPLDTANPDGQAGANDKTWMFDTESVPYSPEADAAIPVGTIMPGVLFAGQAEGDRAHIAVGARWENGHWYAEMSRDLVTGSTFDKDFVPGKPLYVWVAVFDHTQTRHTRHVRPVKLELR